MSRTYHATVLDLACGDGFYTRLLKEAGARELTGVDISHTRLGTHAFRVLPRVGVVFSPSTPPHLIAKMPP